MKRGPVDPDQVHAERLEHARHDLELWGRWVMQRTDGGLGYGQSVLADLQRVSQSAGGYEAPIVETHCSWVDDIVSSLPEQIRVQCRLHFGGRFSFAFIARQHRCAPATVSRNIATAIRTVSDRTLAPKRSSYAM